MFQMGVSAIEFSMSTGDESITTLIEGFAQMNGVAEEVKGIMQEASDSGYSDELHHRMSEKLDLMVFDLKRAVISFQFYDRLTQQLDSIALGLDKTADLVGDQERLYNPIEWKQLQSQIIDSFTMEEPKVLFRALMRGATKEEALREAIEYGNKDADHLELF